MKKGNHNKFVQMEQAYQHWKKNCNASLNHIAAQFNISHSALSNYITKQLSKTISNG